MKTRRGDVVLVLFPNSDLRTAKRRPAIVLQRDNLGSGLEQTIVAMISSNLARRGHLSRVFISAASREGKTAGVRLDSVVMTDNLATVLENEIDSALGNLPDMADIDAALGHTRPLGLTHLCLPRRSLGEAGLPLSPRGVGEAFTSSTP